MTGEVFDSHECVSRFAFRRPVAVALTANAFFFLSFFLSVVSVTTWSAILSASDEQRNKLGGGSGKGASSRKAGAESQGGSWFGFFFKLLLFAAVCAGVMYGYKTYMLNQRKGYRGSPFGSLGYESRRRF